MGKTNKADQIDPRIIRAIRQGALDKLRSVVEDGQGALRLDRDTLTFALCTSCISDRLEIVNYWLDRNVSPKDRGARGRTPLMVTRSRAVAAALIDRGANVDAVDDAGRSSLMHTRSLDVATFLVEQHANLELTDKLGNTALINMILVDISSHRAICAKIADLLITKGANVNAADLQGRPVLVASIWKNQTDIVQRLIDQGADVDQLDVRGRNVLHHLCEDETRACRYRNDGGGAGDEVMMKALLRTTVDINRQEPIEGKTPLHCALVSNHPLFIHILLDNKPPAKVNVQDYRGTTALHIAAGNGWHEIVDKLIQRGAHVGQRATKGWTPLHFSAVSAEDSVDTVRLLLEANADVTATTDLKKSALHLAAEAGNIEIVRFLLTSRPGQVDATKRDAFGNNALICAAKAANKSIVRLLVNYTIPHLDAEAKMVAEEMKAMVVDFDWHGKTGPRLTPRRVFDLIFGSLSVFPEDFTPADIAVPGSNTESGSLPSRAFRWVHLPANNSFWCRGSLIKLFLEEDGIDGETFQSLLRSFDHQHKGKHLHARYMRPTCHSSARTSRANETEVVFNSPDPSIDLSDRGETESRRSGHDSRTGGPKSSSHKGGHPASRRRRGHDSWLDSVQANIEKPEDLDQDLALGEVPSVESTGRRLSDTMYLFMPYLHFETFRDRNRMNNAILRMQGRPSLGHGIAKIAARYAADIALDSRVSPFHKRTIPDEKLIEAHATSENATLQIRRTLDQFFYRTIDTSERDRDQVVHRYQKRVSESDKDGRDANILMVDQLWMWIVNEDLIITSFPRRWGQDNDDDGIWESIYRDIQSTARRPVEDVYELAMIIAGHCFGWIDRRESWHDDTLFLDMFDSSIGHAMNEEVRLFKVFQKASRDASSWLKKIRGYPLDAHSNKEPQFPHVVIADGAEGDDDAGTEAPGSQPVFVQTLLDIGAETRLLEEVKDIRDELSMLEMIFKIQKELVPEIQSHILAIMPKEKSSSARRARIDQLHQDQMRYILNPLRDIERMDRQAKRIYDSIRNLLDLKQKHANAMQATETQRQGKTLMVFTIVTVIFLPLSFLAAFFAINITAFPRDRFGNQQMSIGFVSKYIFGIGVAIALMCVALAWSAEKIDIIRLNVQRWIWRQISTRGLFRPLRSTKETKNSQGGRTDTNLSTNTVEFVEFVPAKQKRTVSDLEQAKAL